MDTDDQFFLITAIASGLTAAFVEAVDTGASAIELSETIVDAMDAGATSEQVRDLIQLAPPTEVVQTIRNLVFVPTRLMSNNELYDAFMDAVAAGDVPLLLSSVVFKAIKSGVSDRQLIHAMKSSSPGNAVIAVAALSQIKDSLL